MMITLIKQKSQNKTKSHLSTREVGGYIYMRIIYMIYMHYHNSVALAS